MHLGHGQDNVIDIDAYAGIGEGKAVDLADAADIDNRIRSVAFVQREVWHRALNVTDVARLQISQTI